MHTHSIEPWTHDHAFLGVAHERNERRTMLVVALTAAMMIAEIVGGTIFGSMALVADGWHMSTHAAALGIAAVAYRYARTHQHDRRFSFGTGKLGELAAFSSAIILAMIALYIGVESASRLLSPVPIAFGEAIPIAVVGLGVNLVSAWLLHSGHDGHGGGHGHHHAHGGHHHHHGEQGHHHHRQEHHHHDRSDPDHRGADRGRKSRAHAVAGGDTNVRAAYVHVMADALTSVLAIVALTAGRLFGWSFLDPLMGLFGTIVIAAWAISLIRSAGATLLDVVPSEGLAEAIRAEIEQGGDRVADLHLWRLGPGHAGVILAVVSDNPAPPDVYKHRLAGIEGLSHVTVEVHRCGAHARAA